MKGIVSISGWGFMGLIWLASCKQASQHPEEAAIKDTVTVEANVPPFADSVGAEGTASTALDFAGSYNGVLPCADCDGIATTLSINANNSFTKTNRYLGKGDGKPFEVSGTWSWVNGNIIKLNEVTDAPNRYFVSENKVIQLDMEGNRIGGNLAEKYILNKVP
jgi:uncharacterized lipoprotein NlpE involved in copper resistance